MTTALLVSDNSLFIGKTVPLLESLPELTVRVCLNSTGIFDAYLQHHPTVIFLDHAILLPIVSILRHFSAYGWSCAFIAIGKPRDGFILPELIYAEPERASLLRALERWQAANASPNEASGAALATAALQESHPLGPDIYYLMLSTCIEPGEQPLEAAAMQGLRQQLTAIGETDVCTALHRDVLILMKKSTMSHGAFRQVHSIICRTLGPGYGSICCEELGLEELDQVLASMLDAAALCPFFASGCLELSQIAKMYRDFSAKKVLSVYEALLTALFAARPDTLQADLHKWYLSELKPSLALHGAQHARRWQAFFDRTVLSAYADDAPEASGCIETRYRLASQHWSAVYQRYHGTPFLPVVQNSVCYLLAHYDEAELSLETVAAELGFSNAYVSRIFRRQTGITLVDFLQQLRMECAAGLLGETQDAVRTVAKAVGYEDAQYFSKLFCRYTGMYPTQYRTRKQKEC